GLSTIAGVKIGKQPWVIFQSAGWVNFQSAPTVTMTTQQRQAAALGRHTKLEGHSSHKRQNSRYIV
ncbi:hypothetical protein ACIP1G_25335, partial [Pseudomonas sp. NPDC089392]|uniref:hypothetical protein n=1 Tax=Pseudomonas sp. NPDC089392 TaxID=3364459 RepID=UPI0037FC94F1